MAVWIFPQLRILQPSFWYFLRWMRMTSSASYRTSGYQKIRWNFEQGETMSLMMSGERQGFLQTTDGNVVHYGYIEKFIERLGERFNIREISFDRWGSVQMVQNLEGMGFTLVPFGQGFKDMSPPTKELMKLTLEQKLAHGGHPVLRWMMDNIYIRTDPAGNIKADKEKSTEKIDGAVATIMGLDRAIRCGNNTGASV